MTMVEEIKQLLSLGESGTKHDSLIESTVLAVKAAAYAYMEKNYDVVTNAVALLDGEGPILYLPQANITAIEIEVDGIVLVKDEEYFLWGEAGRVKASDDTIFPALPQSVKVTYSGGYTEENLPPNLKRAICKQASHEFRRRADPGLSSLSFPDGSVQKMIIDEWLPDVLAELDRRRRISL